MLCQNVPHVLNGIPGPPDTLHVVPRAVAVAWIADGVPVIPVGILHIQARLSCCHMTQIEDWSADCTPAAAVCACPALHDFKGFPYFEQLVWC